jgi:hypothetical protein
MYLPSSIRPVLGALLALCTGAAWAARPMVTDDARIVDPGACQLETWVRFNRQDNEYWALPGCNPTGNLELTIGGANLVTDDPHFTGRSTTLQIQGKTLFRKMETNGYGVGLAVGGVVRSEGLAQQVPQFYTYVPVSKSFLDDRVVMHLNLGAQRISRPPYDAPLVFNLGGQVIRPEPRYAMTWGVGGEFALTDRLYFIAETFGDNHQKPYAQAGLRLWIVPNHVQIDTTLGGQAGDWGGSRWFTIGLRLLSPPFLK